jgi:MFS family permease
MTSLLARPANDGPAATVRSRLAVYLTFAVVGAMMGSWVPRIPEVKARLHLSAGSLGLALLATAIGSLVALPLVGQLVGRFGSRRMTRLFLFLFLAAAVLPGLSTSLAELWLLLFLVGFTMGSVDVAMNAQAVTVEKTHRRPLMSGFHAAWSLGSLFGAGVGSLGIVAGVGIVWQQLGAAVVLGSIALLLSRAFVPDPAAAPAEVAARKASSPWQRMFGSLDGRLVLLGLASMSAMLSEGSVGDWTPVLLRDSLHAQAAHVGFAYAGFMILQTIGRVVGDRVIERLGRLRAIVWMTGIGAAGLVAGMATDTVAGAVAGFTLLGLGLAITVPVAFSAAADGRANAGPALAAVSSLSYTGFLAGPTLIGVVAQLTSVRTALWMLPVIVVGGASLAVIAVRRPADPAAQPQAPHLAVSAH